MHKAGIILTLVAISLVGAMWFLAIELAPISEGSKAEATKDVLSKRLDEFADNIVSGGPPRDGIPPIETPRYVTVSEANGFLHPDDVVFVLEYGGEVRIYPQRILVWHEIVNEVINGEWISVTYCPLTGSVIAFRGLVNGTTTTFGTSGKLLNSNLVMYDRATESLWPQILGVAVSGPLKGYRLDAIPMVWTRWKYAREVYPNAKVLSPDTGYSRPYGRDPYGSYLQEGTYYDSGGPVFPVMVIDDRLEPKEVVVGIRVGDEALAVTKRLLREVKLVNVEVGGKSLVVFYDERLDDARVYFSEADGRTLKFKIVGDAITDTETGSTWSPLGESVRGELAGLKLRSVSFYMNVMWFAWSSFYPDTRLIDLTSLTP
jgi:hypothetical protein